MKVFGSAVSRVFGGFVAFFLSYFLFYIVQYIRSPTDEREHFTTLGAVWSAADISLMQAVLSMVFALPILPMLQFTLGKDLPFLKAPAIGIFLYVSSLISLLWVGAGQSVADVLTDSGYWFVAGKYCGITLFALLLYVLLLKTTRRVSGLNINVP